MSITNVGQSPRIVMLPAPTADVDLWDVLNLQGGEHLYVTLPMPATTGNPPIIWRLDVSKPRPWSTMLPIELNIFFRSTTQAQASLQIQLMIPGSPFNEKYSVLPFSSTTSVFCVVNFKIWTISPEQVIVAWNTVVASGTALPNGLANGKRVDLNT